MGGKRKKKRWERADGGKEVEGGVVMEGGVMLVWVEGGADGRSVDECREEREFEEEYGERRKT